jgi:hypothetical protein
VDAALMSLQAHDRGIHAFGLVRVALRLPLIQHGACAIIVVCHPG